MTDTGERLDNVEGRLAKVEESVVGLRADVDGLRTDVQKLRILEEQNAQQIKLVAEVQSHHGTLLEQHSHLLNKLVKDVEPLTALVRTVVQDHERRIAALEKPGT